jgi:hypothetical protein
VSLASGTVRVACFLAAMLQRGRWLRTRGLAQQSRIEDVINICIPATGRRETGVMQLWEENSKATISSAYSF